MKRLFKTILLAAIFTLVLSVSAFAAEGGIYALDVVDNQISTMPMTAGGTEVADPTDTVIDDVTESLFEGTERMRLTYSGATDGCYYLVVVLKGSSAIPTSDNIVYIDQVTAEGADIDFNVFPSELEADESYTVYLSSNDGSLNKLTEMASFRYYVPYTLGDVDGDKDVSVVDAMCVLQMAVNLNLDQWTDVQWLAADVTGGGDGVDVEDAMLVLQRAVNLITSF